MEITVIIENDNAGLKTNRVQIVTLGNIDPPSNWVGFTLNQIALQVDDATRKRLEAVSSAMGNPQMTKEEFKEFGRSIKLSDVQPLLKHNRAPGLKEV